MYNICNLINNNNQLQKHALTIMVWLHLYSLPVITFMVNHVADVAPFYIYPLYSIHWSVLHFLSFDCVVMS